MDYLQIKNEKDFLHAINLDFPFDEIDNFELFCKKIDDEE